MTIQKTIALKEGINAIKLNAKETASYYGLTPVRMRSHPYKEDLTNAVKLKILFEELTHFVQWKEWGETKEKRQNQLKDGTFTKVNAKDRSKKNIEFMSLSLNTEDEINLKKSGILWT